MFARALIRSLPVAAIVLAAVSLPAAAKESYFWRVITNKSTYVPAPSKPSNEQMPPAPGQVPKTTTLTWRMTGGVEIGIGSMAGPKVYKLTDLDFIPMTFFLADGVMLGGSPFKYWPTGDGSTVQDFCAMLYKVPGWTCEVGLSNDRNKILVITAPAKNANTPPDFYALEGYNIETNVPKLMGAGAGWQLVTTYTY